MQAFTFVFFLFVLLAALSLIGRWVWLNHHRIKQQSPAPPIQFARVVAEYGGSAGTGFGVMMIIFSLVSGIQYFTSTTVLQEMSALLLWIGSNTFWGIFLIATVIDRRQTYVVYSDLALRMETNIARLEKLQEQASSISAVADAIRPSLQVEAELPAKQEV